MSDPVEFLQARYAEEAEVAERELRHELAFGWDSKAGEADSLLVGMFSPSRVLAGLAVRRGILADHKQVGYRGIDGPCCGRCESYMTYPCRTVRLLLSEFAGHPDYDQRWTV